jgi:hypothetical protein
LRANQIVRGFSSTGRMLQAVAHAFYGVVFGLSSRRLARAAE